MKHIFFAALFFFSITVTAQVGIGTTSPNSSAQLDISSANKGLLAPRMTSAQVTAISTPATGLLVFQTDNTPGFYYYNGSAWTQLHTGVLSVANGGTSSAIKNFVDLSTVQTIGGAKSFSSDLHATNITASSYIIPAGTSSQFLKANGSIDNNTYLTPATASAAYLPLTGGSLTGNLTGTGATFNSDVLMGENTAKSIPALKLVGFSATGTTGGGGLELGDGAAVNMRIYRTETNNFNISTTGSYYPYLGINTDNYDPAYTLDINGTLGVRTNTTLSGTLLVSDISTFTKDLIVSNMVIGKGAGQNDQNTVIGASALGSGTGSQNTAVGYATMANYNGTSNDNNSGLGYASMLSLTTGQQNTSIGAEAMLSLTDGSNNTSIGAKTLLSNTGSGNTALGYRAGETLITGSENTLIGSEADVLTESLTNATAIGNGSVVLSNNSIQLGNTSVTSLRTSGSLTTGNVTYPNNDGSGGQVLSTNGSGIVSWTTISTAAIEVADEFTPSAGQTIFTLSHSPSPQSKVKMYINGSRISNTAYATTGSGLTYNPANNGSHILLGTDRIQFDYYY